MPKFPKKDRDTPNIDPIVFQVDDGYHYQQGNRRGQDKELNPHTVFKENQAE